MKKKRFSEEKMVSILREADSGRKTIVELCRTHGISDVTFYARRRMGGISELERPSDPARLGDACAGVTRH